MIPARCIALGSTLIFLLAPGAAGAQESPRYEPAQFQAARRTDSEAEGEDLEAYWRRLALRDHHGLTAMRVLPGNLRYLKVGASHWVRDETGAAYDAALRFLMGGDAVIVDLRGNGGGSHATRPCSTWSAIFWAETCWR